MNNNDILAIREFRRFVNNYIYPYTVQYLIEKIKYYCNAEEVTFEANPNPTIKIVNTIKPVNNSDFTISVHNIIKEIFVSFFNEEEHVKLIRNKIYTDINDVNLKCLLFTALESIRNSNPQYLGLLFNITTVNRNDNTMYLYL